MIDDYSSDAYDDNAFGSDNDDDASIRTNNSGIDENTKAEDSTKANAKNEAVRTNATNNRSNNNQDTTLIEGSGRVEEQQGEASSDSLDGRNDTQQGNQQICNTNNQKQGQEQELEAAGNIEANNTQAEGDNNNQNEPADNNNSGANDERSATNARSNRSNKRQTTIEECRPYHVNCSDCARDE